MARSPRERACVNRREFLKAAGMTATALTLAAGVGPWRRAGAAEARRPNILWISAEDISPDLGCYGEAYAQTPHLDAFASEGTLFSHVFTNAGVCAPMRSCTITAMYPSAIGTNYMRSDGVPPDEVRCFPEYLRRAGYYCSNNVKTDYQFPPPPTAWDANSNRATWRDAPPGQPFFCVINFTSTHESQIRANYQDLRHDPDKAVLPPYYPDTPVTRRDWARYHDLITHMDGQVRQVLDDLEADGLADDTIVWFWGDHGRGLPRAKRWLYDSGTWIPLIIRVPEKWRALASPANPAAVGPGTHNGDLILNADFGPTVMALAGVERPTHFHGRPFLGPGAPSPRPVVFGARDRMDEAVDMIRSARDRRFRYLRNFMAHLSYGQDIDYMNQMPTMAEMRRLNAEGKLEGAQAQYFRPVKPLEELYDLEADPHEIHNLAGDPGHRETLERLRGALREWMLETGDMGLIPEPDFDAMKWPGWQRGETATPIPSVKETSEAGALVALTCPTAGSSIAWRLEGGDGQSEGQGARQGDGRWGVYVEPILVPPGRRLRTLACRIGFRDSGEIVYNPEEGIVEGALQRPENAENWRARLDRTDLLERLLRLRDLDFRGAAALEEWGRTLQDPEGAMRYWAVLAIHHLSEGNAEAQARAGVAFASLLDDPSISVRVSAAEALCQWGEAEKGLPVLVETLAESPSDSGRLYAALSLKRIGQAARPAIDAIRASLEDRNGYVGRVSASTLKDLE